MPKPKPSTISHDPFAFIPATANEGQGEKSAPLAKPETSKPLPAQKPVIERMTISYPVDLIERARNAAYWDRDTLAAIVVQALTEALDRREQERGEPYPPRDGKLPSGRRVGH